MKKLIFLVVCLVSGGMPVFSQTYQELCDRAVTYTEQDSLPQAEDYIRRALKLEPANIAQMETVVLKQNELHLRLWAKQEFYTILIPAR